jgi:arginine exporter protein ArgO
MYLIDRPRQIGGVSKTRLPVGIDSFLHGLTLSGSLIVAIGAQNAFVLRQGLERSHVAATVLICALSDALLTALGILGAGVVMAASPRFLTGVAWTGTGYLLWLAVWGMAARDGQGTAA